MSDRHSAAPEDPLADAAAAVDAPGASLWRNPRYRTFLGMQTLAAIGDSFSYVAVPLLVLQVTGSLIQMGIVTGLTGAASIATGLLAGGPRDPADSE